MGALGIKGTVLVTYLWVKYKGKIGESMLKRLIQCLVDFEHMCISFSPPLFSPIPSHCIFRTEPRISLHSFPSKVKYCVGAKLVCGILVAIGIRLRQEEIWIPQGLPIKDGFKPKPEYINDVYRWIRVVTDTSMNCKKKKKCSSIEGLLKSQERPFSDEILAVKQVNI